MVNVFHWVACLGHGERLPAKAVRLLNSIPATITVADDGLLPPIGEMSLDQIKRRSKAELNCYIDSRGKINQIVNFSPSLRSLFLRNATEIRHKVWYERFMLEAIDRMPSKEGFSRDG